MNIKKLNEELNKILNESILSDTKTKQQAIHRLYKIKHDGIYTDEGWEAVHNIVHKIEEMGGEVDIQPSNNSHYNQGYPRDGSMSCKAYDIKITFINALNKEIVINGQIVCSGCGTVEDPLSRYDVVMMLG